MREIYFKPDLIEIILDKYGPDVGGSWSGCLYEYYILTKIKSLQKNHKYLKLKLKDNHDNDQLIHIAPSKIKKIWHCNSFQTITLESVDEENNCYYIPYQQNFALIDSLYIAAKENSKIIIDLHSLKLNDYFTKNFPDKFKKYYHMYQDQIKTFFGNSLHFKIYRFFFLGENCTFTFRFIFIIYTGKEALFQWIKDQKYQDIFIVIEYGELQQEDDQIFKLNKGIKFERPRD